jgi:biopolymer transport protein ExbD
MGISAGGGSAHQKSDINVTPLVDIVLVLLIIFLVTMPIQMRYLSLEVPQKLDDEVDLSQASAQITVSVRADGSLTINDGVADSVVNRVDLARILRPMLDKKRTEKVVFVDIADDVLYADAVSVMDTIKGAGAEKVALKIREDANRAAPPAP